MKKIHYCVNFMLFIITHSTIAATYITVENGNWTDSTVWLSGAIPAYTCSDTILIRDTVYFDSNIDLNFGAFMQIDSLGGALCGHHDVTVLSGATLNKYGALCLDSLFIKGGAADFILPGVYLAFLTRISDGGTFHLYSYEQSCICKWDTCFIPIRSVIPPVIPEVIDEYTIYPNPSNGNFNVQFTQKNESIIVFYNALGQILFQETLPGASGTKNIIKNSIDNGVYFWEVRSGNSVVKKGRQLIVN